MSKSISRREFIRLLEVGGAASAVLTGCGSMSRYVTRQPYAEMPEYALPGESVFFATTCRECPAGCGLVVRTVEGRALKVEGNPDHPVSRGATCTRGQATVQGLYDPDRIRGPVSQSERGSGILENTNWEAAVELIANTLRDTPPEEIAFLLGLVPDHLFDFLAVLSDNLGAASPRRFGGLGLFDARATLIESCNEVFGRPQIPFFDIGQAEVTYSFGANFSETWISPVAYTRAYGIMRQGHPGQRGYLVQFDSRMSQTGANADEWIPIRPGSEGLVALAIGRLVAERSGLQMPPAFSNANVDEAVERSGISASEMERLARIFAEANRKSAVPGGQALSYSNGRENAQAILGLNALVGNLGQDGGVHFVPPAPVHADIDHRPNSMQEITSFVDRMNQGRVQALFIHGANPLFEMPQEIGFQEALQNVPLVISFNPFQDETSHWVDYIFPDHSPLESWGYQRSIPASDRMVVSGAQPVVAPLYDTRATVDLFLAAVNAIGGDLAQNFDYQDEVDFLQRSVAPLIGESGFYDSGVIEGFWSQFLQHGGWWTAEPGLDAPELTGETPMPSEIGLASFGEVEDFELHLQTYPLPNMGDGSGANRPWLQETPDPMTTVMWNTWVEINPETAMKLGVENDDMVEISSPSGSIQAAVYIYPAIRPDTIGIPFGQGHSALGRYAEERGANPLDILGIRFNGAGDLAYGSTLVQVRPTGNTRPLSRFESAVGIYED